MTAKRVRIVRLVLFAMYGALIYAGQFMMEFLPNIHPVTLFVLVLTSVYGIRALIPIYVYVFIEGLFAGFSIWWLPYLYLWTLQCLISYPITRVLHGKATYIVYPILGALFGITFGTMYAPAQALLFGFDFQTTVKWVISGLPYDALHAVGGFVMCSLTEPMARLIRGLHASSGIPV